MHRLPLLTLCLAAVLPLQAGAPLTLEVDASDAPRRILHATLRVPAQPGPLTLVYPKWIPGEHGPTGPITDLVGLRASAGGKAVTWRRDDADMTAFHFQVPAGATELTLTYDFLLPGETQGFTSAASSSERLALISWNQVLLYPAGAAGDTVLFQPSLRLPQGWRSGTAPPSSVLPLYFSYPHLSQTHNQELWTNEAVRRQSDCRGHH